MRIAFFDKILEHCGEFITTPWRIYFSCESISIDVANETTCSVVAEIIGINDLPLKPGTCNEAVQTQLVHSPTINKKKVDLPPEVKPFAQNASKASPLFKDALGRMWWQKPAGGIFWVVSFAGVVFSRKRAHSERVLKGRSKKSKPLSFLFGGLGVNTMGWYSDIVTKVYDRTNRTLFLDENNFYSDRELIAQDRCEYFQDAQRNYTRCQRQYLIYVMHALASEIPLNFPAKNFLVFVKLDYFKKIKQQFHQEQAWLRRLWSRGRTIFGQHLPEFLGIYNENKLQKHWQKLNNGWPLQHFLNVHKENFYWASVDVGPESLCELGGDGNLCCSHDLNGFSPNFFYFSMLIDNLDDFINCVATEKAKPDAARLRGVHFSSERAD